MDETNEQARAMERNFTRDWQPGDVYAPHDLSAAEARKWRQRKAPTTDAFDVLSLNPLDLYKVRQPRLCCMREVLTRTELCRHVRICYRNGQDTSEVTDWAKACEPEKVSKSNKTRHCKWPDACRPSTS